MQQKKSKLITAATAAGACALSAQLFVAPLSQTRAPRTRALRAAEQVAAVSAAQPVVGSSSSNALPLMGLGVAGAVLLASRANRAEKIARNFFGGGSSSSYRSFDPATEGGVQDPVGFWDPLGLAADKDETTFKRRRAVEIKHGRIAMYATIGYIVPEYYKFPGDLSPSQGIKFADVPNGLAAFSKVPLFGWLQIFFFAGFIETSGFFSGKATAIGFQKDSTQDGEPGNYGVGFPNFIGKVTDPAARASKLNAELANGRLAMMAVIGMFFQDGLTGGAWGDWALYTASPLRAFESELGVSTDGDVAAFCRRSVELQSRALRRVARGAYASAPQTYEGAPISPPPDLPSLLLKERIVYLGTPITNEVAELIIAQLLYLNYESADKPVTMYINSTGSTIKNNTRYMGESKVGLETDAFAIADCMQYIKPQVNTIAIGQAYGTAAVLLSLGAKGKRFALPNATIMLSEPREPPARGPRQAADIQILAREVLRNRATMAELLAGATGKTTEELVKDTSRCYYMTPDSAVEYGLIDKVLTPEKIRESGQELPSFVTAMS